MLDAHGLLAHGGEVWAAGAAEVWAACAAEVAAASRRSWARRGRARFGRLRGRFFVCQVLHKLQPACGRNLPNLLAAPAAQPQAAQAAATSDFKVAISFPDLHDLRPDGGGGVALADFDPFDI